MFLNPKMAKAAAFAASALLLPAAAHAEQRTMDRDGHSYVYDTVTKGDRTVITGKTNGVTPFRLVVRGQHVTGTYNGRQIAFSMREVERNTEVAMR